MRRTRASALNLSLSVILRIKAHDHCNMAFEIPSLPSSDINSMLKMIGIFKHPPAPRVNTASREVWSSVGATSVVVDYDDVSNNVKYYTFKTTYFVILLSN